MPAPRLKPAALQLTLGPDSVALTNLLLASVPSPHTRRSYAKAVADLQAFAAGRPLTRMLLLEWRAELATKRSAATVNVRIAAIRKLIQEAWDAGLLDPGSAADLLKIKGLPRRGERAGNWLTPAQAQRLLTVPDPKYLRGARNYCVLAVLLGCAIRRDELAALDVQSIQLRDNRWVLADLPGKHGRIRTVAIPGWVKTAIDNWRKQASIKSGRLIRRLTLDPAGLSTDAIWNIVKKAAQIIGVPNFGPHDLRRTCARFCREQGSTLEQIQFLLGHESILTTQRYLGSMQDFKNAPNDNLGMRGTL
jgi:integrase